MQVVTDEQANCLNPCFNGRYSLRDGREFPSEGLASLNPCFNGRYSLRKTTKTNESANKVS